MISPGAAIDSLMAKKVYQYAKNLRELWMMMLFWLACVGSPFAKPTLEVKYRLNPLYPPVAAESHVKDTSEKEKADGGRELLAGLVKSRDLLQLTIRNNSTDRIDNVDFQIDGFRVADVALHSNSSQIMADRQKLAAFEISDNFVVRFPNLTTIPPKAETIMLLWGDFNTLLLRGPVKVFSTAKTVSVVCEGTTSGLRLFIATHLSWIAVFVAVSLLLLGLRRST